MIELGLAIGASVAWGASDFVAGRGARVRSVLLVLCASQVVGLALVAVAVVVRGAPLPGWETWVLGAAAGLCEVGAFAAFYAAMASGPMGPVAPVAALGGIVPLICHLVGGGSLRPAAAVGIAAALVGVALVSVESDDGERVARRQILLAFGSAVGFGLFFELLGEASNAGDPLWAVGITRAVAVLVTVPLLLARRTDRLRRIARGARPSRWPGRSAVAKHIKSSDLWWLGGAGALDIGANALYAVAVSRSTDISLSIIGSLYPVTTLVLARLVLREQMSRVQGAGAILTLVGVTLVGGA